MRSAEEIARELYVAMTSYEPPKQDWPLLKLWEPILAAAIEQDRAERKQEWPSEQEIVDMNAYMASEKVAALNPYKDKPGVHYERACFFRGMREGYLLRARMEKKLTTPQECNAAFIEALGTSKMENKEGT